MKFKTVEYALFWLEDLGAPETGTCAAVYREGDELVLDEGTVNPARVRRIPIARLRDYVLSTYEGETPVATAAELAREARVVMGPAAARMAAPLAGELAPMAATRSLAVVGHEVDDRPRPRNRRA